jgi:methylmalonyl-CoA/ethylmalonyl-CoA epimerase
MLSHLSLHHIGLVVRDIASASAVYRNRFGYTPQSDVIHDPIQTAYVQFLSLPNEPMYVELVTPDGPNSKLANAMAKGGGLNHLCFRVPDMDQTCRQLRSTGMILLQAPVAAAAFPGRRIAWLIGDDRTPIELVEQGGDLGL